MQQKISCVLLMVLSSIAQAVEVEATLNWAPKQRYGFVVNGVVDGNVARPGEKVKKGDRLATLDRQPYNYRVKQQQAAVNKIEPKLVDARLEFDQANELFDRTVLSEVELQKIEGNYKALVAEQEIEKARLKLVRWELIQASLTARQDAYVVSSGIYPGMVISEENKSSAFFELAPQSQASAIAQLSIEQRLQLKSESNVDVIMGDQTLAGHIHTIAMQADKDNRYQLVVVFDYSKMPELGKKVVVRY